MTHIARTLGVSLFVLIACALPLAAGAEALSLAEGLSDGMAAYIASLTQEPREQTLYAFDDDECFDLRLAPLGLSSWDGCATRSATSSRPSANPLAHRLGASASTGITFR